MDAVIIIILQRGLKSSAHVLHTEAESVIDVKAGKLGCRTNGTGDPSSDRHNLPKW